MNADSSRSGFLALWEENQLCDVELRTSDDVCIPAHRIVLAAVSPFFRAMFVGSGRTMREGGSSVIDLPGLDEASLRLLLRSIYQDKPDVTEDSVPSLLAAASYLSVGPVRDACCSFLKMHLSLPTAVDTALMADEYNCCELLEEAVSAAQCTALVDLCPYLQQNSQTAFLHSIPPKSLR